MSSLIRVCSSCGAQNRIPAKHVGDTGRCGTCKNPLPPNSEPIDVDPPLFEAIITQARVPVLVDFWASWCGPCRMAAPEVKALAAEMAGKAAVLKVDTEAYPQLAARYGVQGIPNFLVLRNGSVVHQSAGVAPRSQMRSWLEQA